MGTGGGGTGAAEVGRRAGNICREDRIRFGKEDMTPVDLLDGQPCHRAGQQAKQIDVQDTVKSL